MTRKRIQRPEILVLGFIAFLLPLLFYSRQILAGQILVDGDGLTALYPMGDLRKALGGGEFPFWSPYIQAGAPLIELFPCFLYPGYLVCSFLPEVLQFPVYMGIHYAIAGVGMYLYLTELHCLKRVSLAVSFIYLFTVHMSGARKEHFPLIIASAIVPLVLYFLEKYLQTHRVKWLFAGALVMALQQCAGFLQYTVYSDVFFGLYLLFAAIHQRMPITRVLKHGLAWVGAYFGFVAPSVLPTILMLIPNLADGEGNMPYSIFSILSLHPIKLLMTVFPEIFGADVWGSIGAYFCSGFDIELFVGGACVALFFIGIAAWKKAFTVRFYYLMAVLTYAYACMYNTGLFGKAIYHIPLLNMFRMPVRIIFLFVFCILVCVAQAWDRVCRGDLSLRYAQIINAIVFAGMVVTVIVYYSIPWSDAWNIGARRPFTEVFLWPFVGYLLYLAAFCIEFKCSGIPARVRTKVLAVTLTGVTVAQLFPYYVFSHVVDEADTYSLPSIVASDPLYKTMDTNRMSKLVSNLGMWGSVMTLNAYTNYNLPTLYKILNHGVETAPNNSGVYVDFPNYQGNLEQDNDVLSMLGVKYILVGKEEQAAIDEIKVFINGSAQPGDTVFEVHDANVGAVRSDTYQIGGWVMDLEPNSDYLIEMTINFPQDIEWSYLGAYNDNLVSLFGQNFSVYNGVVEYSGIFHTPADENVNEVVNVVASLGSDVILEDMVVKEIKLEEGVYRKCGEEQSYVIYENPNAKPLLYTVPKIEGIQAGQIENVYTDKLDYDMLTTSYVTNLEGTLDISHSNTKIDDIKLKNNRVTATVTADEQTFINMSQNYYSGWTAYVDGKRTELFQVNGMIQGMLVPAGTHTIEFRYIPWQVYLSLAIAAFTGIICLLYCLLKREERQTDVKACSDMMA